MNRNWDTCRAHRAPLSLLSGMAARIKVALDYVAAHPKECEAQVFSMYSWNEFSEGAGFHRSPPRQHPHPSAGGTLMTPGTKHGGRSEP